MMCCSPASEGGIATLQKQARNRALDLAPTIQELHAGGCESLRAIAAGLEERGIPTARGGKWSAVQVSRLLEAARSLSAQASPSRERRSGRAVRTGSPVVRPNLAVPR